MFSTIMILAILAHFRLNNKFEFSVRVMENGIPAETFERSDVPRAKARERTFGQVESPVLMSIFMNLVVVILCLLPLWVRKGEVGTR
jgi:hypothetical protein